MSYTDVTAAINAEKQVMVAKINVRRHELEWALHGNITISPHEMMQRSQAIRNWYAKELAQIDQIGD